MGNFNSLFPWDFDLWQTSMLSSWPLISKAGISLNHSKARFLVIDRLIDVGSTIRQWPDTSFSLSNCTLKNTNQTILNKIGTICFCIFRLYGQRCKISDIRGKNVGWTSWLSFDIFYRRYKQNASFNNLRILCLIGHCFNHSSYLQRNVVSLVSIRLHHEKPVSEDWWHTEPILRKWMKH